MSRLLGSLIPPFFPLLSRLPSVPIPAIRHRGSLVHSSAFDVAAAASKLFLFDKRLKPLNKLLYRQFLALPLLFDAIYILGRYEDAANDLNDPILGDTIFNGDLCETVDFDADKSTPAGDVHAEGFPLK